MAKPSQLDRTIAQLEAERDVLEFAILKLKAQKTAKPAAKTTRLLEATDDRK